MFCFLIVPEPDDSVVEKYCKDSEKSETRKYFFS